jgi:hypothetical protein
VGTAQGVVDGLAAAPSFGDLLVEFGQFASSEPPPHVRRNRSCDHECFCSASEKWTCPRRAAWRSIAADRRRD